MDVPFLKSPYGNGKIIVYFDIMNLVGNYMVVNELKNSYKNSHCKQFFNVHVKKKIWNPSKNDHDMDLWKYGSF